MLFRRLFLMTARGRGSHGGVVRNRYEPYHRLRLPRPYYFYFPHFDTHTVDVPAPSKLPTLSVSARDKCHEPFGGDKMAACTACTACTACDAWLPAAPTKR